MSTKVWVFFIIISFIIIGMGHHYWQRWGLLISFVFVVFFHILVFFFGNSRLLKKMGHRRLKGQDPWGSTETVQDSAHRLGLKIPHLYLMNSSSANVFSLCFSKNRSAICLSQGLLDKLNSKEIEAILIHQVCFIDKMNTFGYGVALTLSHVIIGFAEFLDRIFFFNKRKILIRILEPFSWLILKFSIHHRLYYETDELASQMAGHRQVLAETLWKLDSLNQTNPISAPLSSQAFFIVNPLGLREKNWFFLIHPKIESRIKKLIGYFPI